MSPGYLDKVNEVQEKMKATWKRGHARVPLSDWRTRADGIEAEADALISMAQAQDLRRDMAYLGEAVQRSAAALDGYIQDEIDRARGK
jgi:hypothetical protein